jgi:hypothetical protein
MYKLVAYYPSKFLVPRQKLQRNVDHLESRELDATFRPE